MKRKTTLTLVLIIAGLFVLAACGPKSATVGPTPTATDLPRGTPDTRMATPQFGVAQRPRSQGSLPLVLYSLPDEHSDISGQIYPGDEGTVIGMDATQTWVLVQFGEVGGWTPVNTLALTIAQ